jgi:hypothetical protein
MCIQGLGARLSSSGIRCGITKDWQHTARSTPLGPSTQHHAARSCTLAGTHLNGHSGEAQAEAPAPVASGTGSVGGAAADAVRSIHVLPVKAAAHVGRRLCGIQSCKELCCGLESPAVCCCCCLLCAAHPVTLLLAGGACNKQVAHQCTR